MNIEELKRLAEAATPGPWVLDELLADFYGFEVRTSTDEKVCADASEQDAAYIAAANPAAMLELIRQLEHHKADSEASRHLLTESWKDEYCAMGWIASCRQAVGDDGSSDMPGFVEYLKLLKQQRNELLAALKVFADKYNSAPDGDLGIGLVNGDFFRAIDAITKSEAP